MAGVPIKRGNLDPEERHAWREDDMKRHREKTEAVGRVPLRTEAWNRETLVPAPSLLPFP